jgi:hypothetical protein
MEEIMIQIYLANIHCNEETDEVGADEPYVLVTAVNLASTVPVAGFPVPLPAFEVVKYGSFEDVDEDETHFAPGISQSFWSLTNAPATLNDPDNVIFIVALMENDNGDPEALRGIVKGIVGGSVLGSLSFDRNNKVIKLISDVNSALGTPTGAPNFDDKVGVPQELRFTREELIQAESGRPVSKSLVFNGDGGSYTLTFEARSVVSFKSFNFPDRFIRHKNSLGFIEPINNELDRKDATFRLIPGLANSNCISFESINFPNHFLRHENFRLKLAGRIDQQLFREDATFRIVPGLFDNRVYSFESLNFPGHFIRHKNFELWIDPSDGSDLFRKDATFIITSSLLP